VKRKRCTKCRRRLVIKSFPTCKRRGRVEIQSQCKLCKKAATAKWCAAHRDKVTATRRRYRQAHPDKSKKAKRLYRQRHPERAKAQVRKAWERYGKKYQHVTWKRRLKQVYGMDEEAFLKILKEQKRRCAICRQRQKCGGSHRRRTRLYVDHCHQRKRVRGLLCFRCNVMLGSALDSTKILSRAIAYLRRFR
jgi:hypothetical protein